jgi:hypothetical protein
MSRSLSHPVHSPVQLDHERTFHSAVADATPELIECGDAA